MRNRQARLEYLPNPPMSRNNMATASLPSHPERRPRTHAAPKSLSAWKRRRRRIIASDGTNSAYSVLALLSTKVAILA